MKEGNLILIAEFNGIKQNIDVFASDETIRIDESNGGAIISIDKIFNSGLDGKLIIPTGKHDIRTILFDKNGKTICEIVNHIEVLTPHGSIPH